MKTEDAAPPLVPSGGQTLQVGEASGRLAPSRDRRGARLAFAEDLTSPESTDRLHLCAALRTLRKIAQGTHPSE